MNITQYKRREIETIPAIQIDSTNIAEMEQFYQTTFKIGEYLILPDEREDTDKIIFRKASVWSKEAFESTFIIGGV